MMDHAELDFGIYRIMNQKRADINHFLKFELLPQVKTALADAIMDRLVANASKIELKGDSMRQKLKK